MKLGWIALAVGAGLVWMLVDTSPESAVSAPLTVEARAVPEQVAGPRELAAPESRRRLAPAAESPARATVAVGEPAPAGDLEVHVRYGSDGLDAADVGVYLRGAARTTLGRELRTDANGRARFQDAPDGPWEVHVDRVTRPVRAESGPVVEVWIPRGVELAGRVEDLAGEPVAGARIYRLNERHHDLLQRVAVTDARGRFALRDASGGASYLARADGYQPSELEQVRRGEDEPLRLVLGARGHRLAGRVVDGAGAPVPYAWIAIGADEDARESLAGSNRLPGSTVKPLDREAFTLRADDRGHFETNEVPGGNALVLARPPAFDRARSGELAATTLWIGPEDPDELTLRLAAGAVLAGVARDERGAPVAGLALEAAWEGTAELGQFEDDLGPHLGNRRSVTREDGSYRLTGLIEGSYDVSVGGPRGRELARTKLELAPGAERSWDPRVELGELLQVRLLDPAGRPLEGWGVDLATGKEPYEGSSETERTDARGEVCLAFLPPGNTWDVSCSSPRADGSLSTLPSAVREELRAGDAVHVIRLTDAELPSASVVGRWVDIAGRPLVAEQLCLERRDASGASVELTGEDGAFEFEGLSAGEYTLVTGRSRAAAGVLIAELSLVPEQTLDVGSVSLLGTTRLVVALTAGGVPQAGSARFALEALDAGGREVELLWSQEGHVWTSGAVAPGRYRLLVSGGGLAPAARVLELGSEPSRELTVDRAQGEPVSIEVQLPAGDAGLRHLSVRVRDAEGTLTALQDVYTVARGGAEGRRLVVEFRLLPGPYRAELTLDGSQPRESSVALFVHPAGGEAEEPVRVDLR